jgi:hypothetical protein
MHSQANCFLIGDIISTEVHLHPSLGTLMFQKGLRGHVLCRKFCFYLYLSTCYISYYVEFFRSARLHAPNLVYIHINFVLVCFHVHLYIGCIFPSLFHHQICLMITTYCLCLTAPMDKGKFLMAARRFRRGPHTEYIISLDAEDLSQGSNAYMGKLR